MSALPARRGLRSAITLPMSLTPLAPDSVSAAATACAMSASLICAGREPDRSTSSAFSASTRSLRAAFSYCAIDSRRCLIIFSITPTTAASSSSMRSSTSRCLIAARIRRTVDSRAASFARMAVFMSSVICCLREMRLVHLLRQHLAAQALVMALHRRGELALALGSRLLVVLAGTQLGEKTGLLHCPLEAPHGDFKRLVFLDPYCRHPALGSLGGCIVSQSVPCSASES